MPKLTAVRGEEIGGLVRKGEGNKQKNKPIDTDNSMVIARGKERSMGEVEEGKGGVNADGRRLGLDW